MSTMTREAKMFAVVVGVVVVVVVVVLKLCVGKNKLNKS